MLFPSSSFHIERCEPIFALIPLTIKKKINPNHHAHRQADRGPALISSLFDLYSDDTGSAPNGTTGIPLERERATTNLQKQPPTVHHFGSTMLSLFFFLFFFYFLCASTMSRVFVVFDYESEQAVGEAKCVGYLSFHGSVVFVLEQKTKQNKNNATGKCGGSSSKQTKLQGQKQRTVLFHACAGGKRRIPKRAFFSHFLFVKNKVPFWTKSLRLCVELNRCSKSHPFFLLFFPTILFLLALPLR